MTNTCEQLLQKVYESGFAVDDILLYLDTHPDDRQAMEYYRYARDAYREAKAAYERACGPLTVDGVNAGNWTWIENPWPWEGGSCSCGNMKNACNTR